MIPLSTLKDQGTVWLAEGEHPFPPKGPPRQGVPFSIPAVDSVLPCHGIPEGTIHAWRSQNNYSPFAFFALFAKQESQRSGRFFMWLGEDMFPTPHFLVEYDPNLLARSYFIRPTSKKNKIWILDQVARTKGVACIFTKVDALAPPTLRKLSLAAKDSGAILFLLQDRDAPSLYGALSEWQVSFASSEDHHPHYLLTLNRYKGLGLHSRSWEIRFKGACPQEIFQPPVIEAPLPARISA